LICDTRTLISSVMVRSSTASFATVVTAVATPIIAL
jgi:hypothetical protein